MDSVTGVEIRFFSTCEIVAFTQNLTSRKSCGHTLSFSLLALVHKEYPTNVSIDSPWLAVFCDSYRRETNDEVFARMHPSIPRVRSAYIVQLLGGYAWYFNTRAHDVNDWWVYREKVQGARPCLPSCSFSFEGGHDQQEIRANPFLYLHSKNHVQNFVRTPALLWCFYHFLPRGCLGGDYSRAAMTSMCLHEVSQK